MIRYVLLIILLCIGFWADAQSSFWDSLKQANLQLKLEGQHDAVVQSSRYGDSLMLQEAVIDSYYLTVFRHQEGDALYNLGRYEEAIVAFDRAIAATTDDPVGRNERGTALYDRAFAEYELMQYKQSFETVKEAEAVLSLLENPDYEYLLSVYADLGFQATELGYYEEAEKYLQIAEKLYRQHQQEIIYLSEEQSRKNVTIAYTFVMLYAESGDEVKLLQAIDKFEAIRKRRALNAGEQYMYAVALNHVADFYMSYEERWEDDFPFIQAKKFLDEAFRQLDKDSYPANYAQFVYNQNKALRKSGHYPEALAGNSYLLSIADSNDYRRPFFIAQRGLILSSAGDKQQAMACYREMAQLIHTGKDPLNADYSNFQPSTILNHSDLFGGIMELFRKDYPDDPEVRAMARNMYILALRQFEHTYRYNTFNEMIREFYEKIIDGILATRVDEAGNASISLTELLTRTEEIENRLAWQEHLANRHFDKLRIPDSLLQREMSLRTRIASAKEAGEDEVAVFALEEKLNKFMRKLQEQYPAHAAFTEQAFHLPDLQAKMNKEELILRYMKVRDQYHLFAISQSEIRHFVLGSRQQIEGAIEFVGSQINLQVADLRSLSELYPTFIPLDISAYQHLVILPDAHLYDLPFEILQKSNQYLIQQHAISYATHLVFVGEREVGFDFWNGNPLFLAFSPDYRPAGNSLAMRNQPAELQGASQETDAISALWGGRRFRGKMATRAQFIKIAPEGDLLHLAMHADIDNEQPELSYLLFSADSTSEKLYVEELYGLNLQARLAVLSACNTGKGAPDTRKGMVSLHRAFTYAGVPATVASLWAVPDQATQEIMMDFYSHLNEGKDKAEALRLAKLSYLEAHDDSILQHPFFWAGFVLYGDTGPVKAPWYLSPWIGGILLLVMVAGIILWIRR